MPLIAILMLCCFGLCCPQRLAAQSALSTGNSSDQQQFSHVLQQLSQGALEPLANTDLQTLLAPLGRPDPHDPQIIRQRQRDLRTLIQRLQAPQAQAALQVLNQKAKDAQLLNIDLHDISLLLPSPVAQELLSAAADRYFDHGQFHDFLRVQSLLRNHNDPRIAVAQTLIGNYLRLYEPGLFVADQAPLIDLQAGQAVAWDVHHGYVHACNPWHGVIWQRAVGRFAEIQRGPQHIVIKDPRGFHIIDQQGFSKQLPPIPKVRSISVSAFHAWFGLDQNVYAYHLHSKKISQAKLPETPLCAPIDTQDGSLWLGEHFIHLLRLEQGQVQSFRHGFQARPTWQLSHNGTHIYLIDDQQRSYKMLPYQESLQRDPIRTLARSNQWQAAWEQCQHKHAFIDEWYCAPQAFIQAHWQEMEQSLAWDALTRYRFLCRKQNGIAIINTDSELLQQTYSNAHIPLGAQDFLRRSYTHSISIAGILAAQKYPTKAIPKHISLQPQQMPVQASGTAVADQVRRTRFTAQLLEDGNILVQSHNQRDELLWKHYMINKGYHPSLSFNHRDQYVIVSVGTQHCIILDAKTGSIRARSNIPGRFNDPKYIQLLGTAQLSSYGPAGILNTLLIHQNIQGQIHNRQVTLAKPIRWTLAIHNELLYSDGLAVYRCSDQQVIPMPEAIIKAQHIRATDQGIIADQQLYKWR